MRLTSKVGAVTSKTGVWGKVLFVPKCRRPFIQSGVTKIFAIAGRIAPHRARGLIDRRADHQANRGAIHFAGAIRKFKSRRPGDAKVLLVAVAQQTGVVEHGTDFIDVKDIPALVGHWVVLRKSNLR